MGKKPKKRVLVKLNQVQMRVGMISSIIKEFILTMILDKNFKTQTQELTLNTKTCAKD